MIFKSWVIFCFSQSRVSGARSRDASAYTTTGTRTETRENYDTLFRSASLPVKLNQSSSSFSSQRSNSIATFPVSHYDCYDEADDTNQNHRDTVPRENDNKPDSMLLWIEWNKLQITVMSPKSTMFPKRNRIVQELFIISAYC
jgi:hypothetical protein